MLLAVGMERMEGLGWNSGKNRPILVSNIGTYAEVNVPADVFLD